MPRKNEGLERIREIINKEPEITLDNLMLAIAKAKIKAPRSYVRNVHSALRREREGHYAPAAAPVEGGKGETFQCNLHIPSGGIRIKLSNGKGMIGTMAVTSQGFNFVRANAKKHGNRQVEWGQLAVLFQSGLLR